MDGQKSVEVIILKISALKEELYNLLKTESINSVKVVCKSQALDKLIVQYYNIIKRNNDKIR